MKQTNQQQLAIRVTVITIVANIALSAFKLLAGVLAHSGAMISDAVHSASDVVSSLVVIVGVKLAGKGADEDHPFGHERLECVAAMALAIILAATGIGIGKNGIDTMINAEMTAIQVPGVLALIAAVVSIAVKEGMYWYTRAAAKRVNSGAMMADAWHHRSDALSSVGSFVGILGARLGMPILDPAASLVICFFIVKAAFDILKDAIGKMTDHACDPVLSEEMQDLILAQQGVIQIDRFRSRLFGDRIYVEAEIAADGSSTLEEAHRVAQVVHDILEDTYPQVKHCMIHVNPIMTADMTPDEKMDVEETLDTDHPA